MVGSLPSRTLVQMSLRGNTSPPPNEVNELFAACLRASRLLTSADVVEIDRVVPFSNYVILSEVEGSPGKVPCKRLSYKQCRSSQSLRPRGEGVTK